MPGLPLTPPAPTCERRLGERMEWADAGNGAGPILQANLVIVPRELGLHFLLFCQRNPKPCPLLDVTEPGDPERSPSPPGPICGPICHAIESGETEELVDEPAHINKYWRRPGRFLVGCSFTFETRCCGAEFSVRHIEMNRNVPMFRTNISLLAGRQVPRAPGRFDAADDVRANN